MEAKTVKPKKRRLSQYVIDERGMKTLLKKATGLSVYKEEMRPNWGNLYSSISDEYKEEGAHIVYSMRGFDATNGNEYKVSIYTPMLVFGTNKMSNISLIKNLAKAIRDELDNIFGDGNWDSCNEEITKWKPMCRFSFYVQVPNF